MNKKSQNESSSMNLLFGYRLKELRERDNLTQSELANILGTTQQRAFWVWLQTG